jgi:predicted enzyme related to lactoylglutathione lyase
VDAELIVESLDLRAATNSSPGDYFTSRRRSKHWKAMKAAATPVVHLELHTGNLSRACAFYTQLFDWRAERIDLSCGSYLALEGAGIDAGVVECDTGRPLWLPYVEVPDLDEATGRARDLGASVLLEPREGPAGWRSVVAAEAGAEVALWQSKTR